MGKSRYTDEQKKTIIADYVDCQNYTAVAKKHECTVNLVKYIVTQNPEVTSLCNQKKEDNTRDLLKYMDSKKAKIQAFFDIFTDNISNAELVNSLNLKEQATVFGIVWDKACNPATNINLNKDNDISIKIDSNAKDWSG